MRRIHSLLILIALAVPVSGMVWGETDHADDADGVRARSVGTIESFAGLIQVRPRDHQRWMPVVGETRLRSGDWVRAHDRQGCTAAIGLASGSTVILGPGAWVAVPDSGDVILMQGQIEVRPARAWPLSVWGSADTRGNKVRCTQRLVLSTRDGRLAASKETPDWLTVSGPADTVVRSGEVVVTLGGAESRLPVGYQKVTVDIRDQIATTVIEQSFENQSEQTLEGVFNSPSRRARRCLTLVSGSAADSSQRICPSGRNSALHTGQSLPGITILCGRQRPAEPFSRRT